MTSRDLVPEAAPEEPDPGAVAGVLPKAGAEPVDWLLVGLISALTGFIALLGLAFLPLYVGSVPLPISVLLGIAAMIVAPRVCYRLTGSLAAAVAPVLVWFAVSVWFVLKYNRLLPMLPLTVVQGQWRVMLLLGLGSLAAAATIGLIWADRLKVRMTGQQAPHPGAAPDPAPLDPPASG